MQLCDFSTDKIFMAIKCKNNEVITFATEHSAVCTIHLDVSTVSTIIVGAFKFLFALIGFYRHGLLRF